jgi:hypothetical protein
MKPALIVFALLISTSAYSKKLEYHWKTGTLTFVTVETDQPAAPPSPDLAVIPGIQVFPKTWTYQVAGNEGVYIVKTGPEALSDASGVSIHYDIDAKTMHVDATANGKKQKIKDLHISKFTPR